MRVAFFSNFLNHHQLPFCLEMQKRLGNQYTFVAFEPVPQDRLSLGYHDMNEKYDFVIRAYEDEEGAQKASELAKESDILILGSAPKEYLRERAKIGKISFFYSERIYKTGVRHMFSPTFTRELISEFSLYRNRPVYLLCAGAYVSKDYAFLGNFIGKTYKWGYFPKLIEYDIGEVVNSKPGDKIHLLWAGRFLNWKHPELAVEIANKLKKENYDFELIIMGEGEKEHNIRELIRQYSLENYVHMLGPKPPEEVREEMLKAHIFLFTSDRAEGWGAVLNEAMNSGCAIVANKAIGAVPFLIKNKWNGLCYEGNNTNRIYKIVKFLIDNEKRRKDIAINAYNTIANEWNAGIAADRILELSDILLENSGKEILRGICSKC